MHKAGIAGLLVLASAILAYLPGLGGSFIFDDYPQIVHQPAFQLGSLDLEGIRSILFSFQHGIGRPIPMLSLAIDHRVWGLDPFGYKLSGLIIHALNALLVFALTRRLLAGPDGKPPERSWLPAALALAWAIHPLQVSTVLYVVQRMETLATMSVLGALLLYLSGRRRQLAGERAWPRLLLCIPVLALGLACKETAALFPVYAFCLELTVLGFGAASARTGRRWRIAYAVIALAGITAVIMLAPRFTAESAYAIRAFTAEERVLTQLRVLPMYLGWILLPQPGQYLFYYDHFPPSLGLLEPSTTLAGGVLLLLLAASALLLRRRIPLYALGVGWFLAAHLITSSYLPLELVFEHRNYFAILGVVLAVYGLARQAGALADRRILAAAGGVAMSFLFAMCLLRSATWGDPLHLALELAQNNPASPRAGTHLADTYVLLAGHAGDAFIGMAEAEYERAAALPGASPIPEQGLIILAARTGRPVKPEWWQSLLHKLQTQAIGPQEMSVVTSLLDLRQEGLAIDDGRIADAYIILASRMRLPPTQYFAFGVHALVALGDGKLANNLFQLTIDHADGNVALLAELSAYLRETGQPEAAEYIETQAGLAPGRPEGQR